jgi:cytochrome c6
MGKQINTLQGGYRAINNGQIQERAWYSINKEIAHGENQVGILIRSGQKKFKSLIKSLYAAASNPVSAFLSAGRQCVAIVLIMGISFTIVPNAQAEPIPSTAPPAPAVQPAPAPTLGSKVFNANCAACHIGGNNVILAEKNLSKDALAKYAMDSIASIKTQVTGGKNAMPAFGENLTSAEIEAVARYVLTQSQQDWKGSTVGLQ